MIKRRRRKKSLGKQLIIISSIVLINFTGVTYAAWNDGLQVNTSITMGEMTPAFCPENSPFIEDITNQGNGDLEVEILDDDTIKITGEVDSNYQGFLHYCVVNKGDVPIKFDDIEPEDRHKIQDGLKLQLNQPSSVILPNEYLFNENGNPKLKIQAKDPGTYCFDIDLLFDQFINGGQ